MFLPTITKVVYLCLLKGSCLPYVSLLDIQTFDKHLHRLTEFNL